MFPYTEDVRREYPFVIKCESKNEADQWEKYRWLISKNIQWGKDFIAIQGPLLSSPRMTLYDTWAFKEEKISLLFALKWL